MPNSNKSIDEFLANKSALSIDLFNYFTQVYSTIGVIELRATKTMIGIYNIHKSVAWVTTVGKNFIHIVFPFRQPYYDNLCFLKIAQVPGDVNQFNHHFKMMSKDDINEEVKAFMKLAYFQNV